MFAIKIPTTQETLQIWRNFAHTDGPTEAKNRRPTERKIKAKRGQAKFSE